MKRVFGIAVIAAAGRVGDLSRESLAKKLERKHSENSGLAVNGVSTLIHRCRYILISYTRGLQADCIRIEAVWQLGTYV